MTTTASTDRITLYLREGSSDKVYQIAIEPAGSGFVVNVAYGRRGSTLTTGTKTLVPVDHDKAKAVSDKLVREKSAKGYTPGTSGTPYQHTPLADRSTGRLPQLLNPIEEAAAQALLNDDAWCLQEKLDGRRVLIEKSGDKVVVVNRRGLVTGLPICILGDVHRLTSDFALDGECVGDRFHVFDLLTLDGEDLRPQRLDQRLVALMNLLFSAQCPCLPLVGTKFKAPDKRRRFEEIKTTNGEGVVFKRLDAPYTPSRPSSGGTALKHKFTATLSAVVSLANAQRSVAMRLHGPKGWQPAGNVTIPANHRVPRAGDVIEVRYLYAFRESGVLFQPVYLGVRTDITQDDCVVSQLKFKASDED